MSNSKSRLTLIAAAVILGLLAINAYLLYNKFGQDQQIVEKERQLDEVGQLKADLEKQYFEAMSDLEEMRSSNEELNKLIDSQKEELKGQKNKISRLINSDRVAKSDLEDARLALDHMMQQRDQYVAEINTLKKDKEALTARTLQLAEEKNILQTEVSKERVANEELVVAKAALTNVKEDLEAENLELSGKVDRASVVKVNNVLVSGWKIRKNGKGVKKRYAKNIDRLEICFNATSNAIVASSNEQFYVRMITPTGETMAIEDLGSGVLKDAETGDEIRFTKVKEIDYKNEDMMSCMLWEPGLEFQSGAYKVEIYNKGFLCGTGNFLLK